MSNQQRFVKLTSHGTQIAVNVSKITYLQYTNGQTRIYLNDDEDYIAVNEVLDEIVAKLNENAL